MKIFGLNILTDEQLEIINSYSAVQEHTQIHKYFEESTRPYRERWERDQETIKSLRTEIESRHQSQMSIQKICQDVTKENERLNKQLIEAIGAMEVVKALRTIKEKVMNP